MSSELVRVCGHDGSIIGGIGACCWVVLCSRENESGRESVGADRPFYLSNNVISTTEIRLSALIELAYGSIISQKTGPFNDPRYGR